MKSERILAVGSVALDSVETPFGKVKDTLGGSASFFGAAARFFAPVSLVAVVGEDFPKKHLRLLEKCGVDIGGIETARGKTFRWRGFYDYDLNNARTLKTELNVFQSFKPRLSPEHRASRIVFLANIDPDIQRAVLDQVRNPSLVACDTMNYWIEHKKKSLLKLLARVDIFLCNDSEARELSGEYNLIKAARGILARGPRLALIKKGEHGVLCFSQNSLFSVPAYLLEKIFDPTGAGDSFAGGFLGYVSKSPNLSERVVRRAVIYGTVLASYNVESFSLSRLARLTPAEIAGRYKEFQKLTRF
ncbi:MAG: sugar kinase [Candidatus Omnitrophica bacterium]|nr:sugar kinase [Candidatus Omnitrophota bacterium]